MMKTICIIRYMHNMISSRRGIGDKNVSTHSAGVYQSNIYSFPIFLDVLQLPLTFFSFNSTNLIVIFASYLALKISLKIISILDLMSSLDTITCTPPLIGVFLRHF